MPPRCAAVVSHGIAALGHEYPVPRLAPASAPPPLGCGAWLPQAGGARRVRPCFRRGQGTLLNVAATACPIRPCFGYFLWATTAGNPLVRRRHQGFPPSPSIGFTAALRRWFFIPPPAPQAPQNRRPGGGTCFFCPPLPPPWGGISKHHHHPPRTYSSRGGCSVRVCSSHGGCTGAILSESGYGIGAFCLAEHLFFVFTVADVSPRGKTLGSHPLSICLLRPSPPATARNNCCPEPGK